MLKDGLVTLNKRLPAQVYIPFLKGREYTVLNILTDETVLFKTKERAPYLVYLEVYRSEEAILDLKNRKEPI